MKRECVILQCPLWCHINVQKAYIDTHRDCRRCLDGKVTGFSFFIISSNFTYNKACVLPKDEMGQINEQV